MSEPAPPPTRVTVSLDQIDEIARKGIRRAVVFMGIGVNAANAAELTNYHLTQDTTLHLLPAVPPEIVSEWKQQFRLWVVGCGFREMVDALCHYLHRLRLELSSRNDHCGIKSVLRSL